VVTGVDSARSLNVIGPMSDEEQPELDDGTLSEVLRRPTRAAGLKRSVDVDWISTSAEGSAASTPF
jgi:hypothetical protein